MSPENSSGDQMPSGEVERPEPPKIYVASLSDYNAGRLHGAFINADQPADDIHQQIQEMLAKSHETTAEEWAIHDYDGFFGLHLSEYESIEHVSKIGRGIAEHGPAFAAWAGLLGTAEWDEDLDKFEECYRGEWPSLEAYAEDLLDDLGIEEALDSLGDWLRPYVKIDVEGFGRDISTDLNIASSPSGGVYLFD